SDASFERKFLIARENTLAESKFYQLTLFQVVSIGETHRSWFYGESVVSDGAIRLLSPIHPLFLALPYFMKSKSKFVELEEILNDAECPSIAVLLKNDQLLKNLDKIADVKEVCDTKVYRFNENKTLEWISDRFQRLRNALTDENCLHKSIAENQEVLDRYSFGVLCDFLSPEMSTAAKAHLCIKDPPADENGHIDMSMKRKAEDIYEDIGEKPAKVLIAFLFDCYMKLLVYARK
ncbi:protein family protein, partial [Oesophagostomum dentatum]